MSTQPTRDRILAAALELFAERGFTAASIGEIEAEAGLSPRSGALYKHFPSKQALLEAAFEQRIEEIDAFNARFEPTPLGDLRAELTLVARWGLAELARERDLVRIVMREGERVPGIADRFYEAIVRRGLELATRILERYAAERNLAIEDPAALGEVVCASLVGFSLQRTLFGERSADPGEERFVAAWVESTAAIIESLERSQVHA
jgi:AcrR family transcriptional regulator